MKAVTVRELRNNGADVLNRVEAGERLTVTRSGRPVAELMPLATKQLNSTTLLAKWRLSPRVDLVRLRRDLDSTTDSRL